MFKIIDHEVYDHKSFFGKFIEKAQGADSLILIQSPFASPRRVEKLERFLKPRIRQGVRVCFILQELDPRFAIDLETYARTTQAVEFLVSMGAHVCFRPKIHAKVAIIDGHILCDGSLNIGSHYGTSERVNWFNSPEMARHATSMLALDTCDTCLSMLLSSDNLQLLRLSITKEREALGISQTELATMSGIARSTISSFESGKLTINVGTLLRLCSALRLAIRAIPDFMCPALDEQLFLLRAENRKLSLSSDTPKLILNSHVETFTSDIEVSTCREQLSRAVMCRRQCLLLTQSDLAQKTNLSRQTINEFESNKLILNLDPLLEISKQTFMRVRLLPEHLAPALDATLTKVQNREQEQVRMVFDFVREMNQKMKFVWNGRVR